MQPLHVRLKEYMRAGAFLPAEFCDFLQQTQVSVLLPNQQELRTLPSSVLKTIFSKQDQQAIEHDHLLVKTGHNVWHIVNNQVIGEGGFGQVRTSTWKIVIESSKQQATMHPVDDVVKIQKIKSASIKGSKASPTDTERLAQLQEIRKECKRLQDHRIDAKSPVPHKDSIYFVMPNLGVPISRLMPKNSFNFDDSFNMAYGMLNDLFILTGHHVIHRDLKPDNICCKEITGAHGKISKQYRYIDFGLAVGENEQAEAAGTPAYIAPEILDNKPPSQASDIYALAGIFIEIFGGKNFDKLKRGGYGNWSNPYCLEGLFGAGLKPNTVNIPADVDPQLLLSMQVLFLKMSDLKPEDRPTAEQILRFFSGITYRRQFYGQYRADVEQLNAIDQEVESVLGIRLPLPALGNMPNHFALSMLKGRGGVQEMYSKPQTQWDNTKKLMIAYADEVISIKPIIQALFNQLNNRSLLKKTNSDGVKKMAAIIQRQDGSMLDKLIKIQQIARKKTADTLGNKYSRSHFFGKGRHDDVEGLYQTLANLILPDRSEGLDLKKLKDVLEPLQEIDLSKITLRR